MTLRAPRPLLFAVGLFAAISIAALWIQKQRFEQRSRHAVRQHAEALDEDRRARRHAERLLAAERGARAALLAKDHPGNLEALQLGLLATSGAPEVAPAELPPGALYGLTEAVAARGYPRFPPWIHVWSGEKYREDIYDARFTLDGNAVLMASSNCDWRRRNVRTGREESRVHLPCGSGTEIALSADGSRVIVLDLERGLQLWNAATSSHLTTIDTSGNGLGDLRESSQARGVRSLGFTPGNRYAFAVNRDTVRIWEARISNARAVGALLSTVRNHGEVSAVRFSPDGSRMIVVDEDLIAIVRDTETGAVLLRLSGHTGPLTDACFSPDGTRVLTTSEDHTARLFDLVARPQKVQSARLVLRGHEASLQSATFSPDGKRIATVSDDWTARLWDAATGEQQSELQGHTDDVLAAVFSPDGTLLVTADKSTVRLWDAASPRVYERPLVTLPEIPGDLHGVSFSPDGSNLLVHQWQRVQLFSVRTAAEGGFADAKRTLRSPKDELTAAAFSPDGRRVLTCGAGGTCCLWDVAIGSLLAMLSGHGGAVRAAAFSPDGTRIATVTDDGTTRLWEATGQGAALGALRATLKDPGDPARSPKRSWVEDWGIDPTVRIVGFSPDSRILATASDDATARLWDATAGALRATLRGHSKRLSSIAFSPDGTRVLTSSFDDTARLWDARTGAALATLGQPTGGHPALARFSPDGVALLTASPHDGVVRRWDARTFAPQKSIEGCGVGVYDIDFSPDGRRLLTAGFVGEVHLWDLATAASEFTFRVDGMIPTAARFTAGGTRLFTASNDLRLSDAGTGTLIARFTDRANVAVLSPDGARVLTAGVDHQPFFYSLRLADYVTAACALLAGHPAELQEVAELCSEERLARLTASARPL